MLDVHESKLDWVLEMNKLYPIEKMKFERASEIKERSAGMDSAMTMATVLSGNALREFEDRRIPEFLRKKAK